MIAQPPGKPTVAVVGAGPGGLAAAVMLQAAGCDVTVYERQPSVGGRTARLEVGPYRFDTGPTFFLMPYVLEEIFAACGRRLSDYATLDRLDPMYRLVIGRPGGKPPVTIDATQDVAEMGRRIAEISPRDGAQFERFIADNRAKLNAAEPILRRPINSPLDLVRGDAIKAAPHIKPHLSVHQLLSKYFQDPSVRLAVSFQSKYLGMSPFDCPSLFTILPLIEYEYGVWHPRGGCNALMRAMADLLTELGGRIVCGADVQAVEFDPSRTVRAITVNGERTPCDHAVINADAAWALKTLIPERLRPRAWSDENTDKKRYSCSTYMLYLGVDVPPDSLNLPHHSIYTSTMYEQNLDDIGRDGGCGGCLSQDPSFYLCNPSLTDPTLAPPGHSALYLLMPTPNGRAPIDWDKEAPAARERVLDQLKDRLGFDARPHIRAEKQITPDDWRGMNINFGATFNLAHNLGQMLHKRPRHELPGAKGCWFVGGGTHPGSGLPVIFLSSQITARLLCARAGLGDPTLARRTAPRDLSATHPHDTDPHAQRHDRAQPDAEEALA